jgi:GNAT superfamily N-acetyltransferase
LLRFVSVESREDPLVAVARKLILTYAEELAVDLCFQGFDDEIANLPGKYASPAGALLLAETEQGYVGCGAFRDLGDGICELKRIFVAKEQRGKGIARTLSIELLNRARARGYKRARLDTLARLAPALALYRSLGFREIPPYNFNPQPDITYFEIELDGWPT